MTGAHMAGEWELPNTAIQVLPARLSGALAAPGSKSVTNRLLVLAALAQGDSVLRGPLDSDDTRAMRGLIEALGAAVTDVDGGWNIGGTGGSLHHPRPATVLDARLSGTTMRFGLALATLARAQPPTEEMAGGVRLTGEPPLLVRPLDPLADALRQLGARIERLDDGSYRIAAATGLAGGDATVDVSKSSQYASAVLMVAPYAAIEDVRLTITGDSAAAYIDLTVDAMRRWGVTVEQHGGTYVVPHGQRYQARAETVEYDASAAAHLFTLAAASGGHVTVTNAAVETLQADAAFPRLLADWGCGVTVEQDNGDGTVAVAVSGPLRGTGDRTVDLGAMPDQLPNAAVLACLRDGVTELRGAEVVRGHETDRIAALASELSKLGADITELPDGLRIAGPVPPPAQPVRLATHDDHRLAMAFAALGAVVPNLVIEEPWCVRKTYPAFWTAVARLGGHWAAEGDA